MTALDHIAVRALVEAGYLPLSDYVRAFGSPSSGELTDPEGDQLGAGDPHPDVLRAIANGGAVEHGQSDRIIGARNHG